MFKFHYVKDYDNLKECILDVEESLISVENTLDMVVMVFDNLSDVELMPEYEEKFFIDGQEVDEETADNRWEDVVVEETVIHNVDYTKNIVSQPKLLLHYVDDLSDREYFEHKFEELYNV